LGNVEQKKFRAPDAGSNLALIEGIVSGSAVLFHSWASGCITSPALHYAVGD
jgi:hypothetical protein